MASVPEQKSPINIVNIQRSQKRLAEHLKAPTPFKAKSHLLKLLIDHEGIKGRKFLWEHLRPPKIQSVFLS